MARGTWGGVTDPHVWRVNFRFTLASSHAQFGFFLRDRVLNDNTSQDVVDEVLAQLDLPFRSLLSPQDVLESIDAVMLGTEDGATLVRTPAQGQGGSTVTSDGKLPNFVAANVSLKSEIRKRYGQGRFYLPVVNEQHVTQNLLNNDGVTAINGFITPLVDHFGVGTLSNDLILCNAHPAKPQRLTPGVPGYRPALPASWYDVVSVRVNTEVTMLRSRKISVGT